MKGPKEHAHPSRLLEVARHVTASLFGYVEAPLAEKLHGAVDGFAAESTAVEVSAPSAASLDAPASSPEVDGLPLLLLEQPAAITRRLTRRERALTARSNSWRSDLPEPRGSRARRAPVRATRIRRALVRAVCTHLADSR